MMKQWHSTIQFLGLGLLLIAAYSGIGGYLAYGNAVQKERAKIELGAAKDTVILGNSTARSIDAEAICAEAINVWQPSQDWFELEAMASLIASGESPPRNWLLVLSPLDYGSDSGAKGNDEQNWSRRRAYRTRWSLGEFGLIDNDWRTALVTALFPSAGLRDWTVHFRAPFRGVSDVFLRSPLYDSTPGRPSRSKRAAKLVATAKRTRESISYYDSDTGARSTIAVENALERIAELGGNAVIVLPPLSIALRDEIAQGIPEQSALFDGWIAAQRASGQTILDFRNQTEFIETDSFYTDGLHMTEIGSAEFSLMLADALRAEGDAVGAGCP